MQGQKKSVYAGELREVMATGGCKCCALYVLVHSIVPLRAGHQSFWYELGVADVHREVIDGCPHQDEIIQTNQQSSFKSF